MLTTLNMATWILQISFFILFCSSDVVAKNCTNTVCPSPRECNFPKSPITIADPNDECCLKLICVCKGTASRSSSFGNYQKQFDTLKRRYTNCTLVDGNLELTGVRGNSPIDFTKHIEQVTGYVLISRVLVNRIDLSSLRLIRGSTKYIDDNDATACGGKIPDYATTTNPSTARQYSLIVEYNDNENVPPYYLQDLWMPKLTEISDGDVKFVNNSLCNVKQILWKEEILKEPKKQEVFFHNYRHLRNCTKCSHCPSVPSLVEKNASQACWGTGSKDLCQIITKSNCAYCGTNRCNLPQKHCCDSQCTAGCTNENRSDKLKHCYACLGMNDNGTCVQECPWETKMKPSDGSLITVQSKYQFARYCVTECPYNVPRTGKYCKRYCPRGTFDYANNECTPYQKKRRGRICFGLGLDHGPLKDDNVIDASNLVHFDKNCTIIEGSLFINSGTFTGDKYCHIRGETNLEAFKVFENVEEITGYLSIEAWPFVNLCVFKNLKRIRGKELKDQRYALTVYTESVLLKELCFNSLERIDNGQVSVASNPHLCFVPSIKWAQINNNLSVNLVKQNQDPNNCGQLRIIGNSRLCMPGPSPWPQIISGYSSQASKIQRKKKPCKDVRCHSLCDQGCWGKLPTQCRRCLHYTDKTNDDGRFTPDWVIDPVSGLSVPGYNVTTCVKACDYNKGVYTSDKMCLPCHEECSKTCTGPGSGNCTKCKNVVLRAECVNACPLDHYTGANKTCLPCSPSCSDGGCTGPLDDLGVSGCLKCHTSHDPVTHIFTYRGAQCQICSKVQKEGGCPHGCTSFNQTSQFECYTPPSNDYTTVMIIASVLVAAIFVVIVYFFYRHRKAIASMRKTIGQTMVGEQVLVENEATPLTPSGASPNQAQLRIVKETELAMGKLLGSGAFGDVRKAVWAPMNFEGEKVKIAVAVKTLKTSEEISVAANNEIMDEAYMMASVDCIYLVRLLGICMTQHVSLITQLMPLGSLLEYVRDPSNHNVIHSGKVLTWCTQIAKGMQYLEEKHLVHRDLAARNVLVKTPNHVKITDFGLAKMLNAKEDIYHAEGGKLPIKWLAIECITNRTFSHLSDVWAFGVTCWELLTLGSRPYDGVRAVEMLSLLERGDRLPQPPSATIDIYMILIKCWMVDRTSRPTFAQLVQEFTAMAKDPTRFVVMRVEPGTCVMSPNSMDEAQFFRKLLDEERMAEEGEIIADEPDQYLLFGNPLNNSKDNKYTPMLAVNSSTDVASAIASGPEYANQSAINNAAPSAESDPPGHDRRLFSRNTPSALSPSSLSSSTNGGARISGAEITVSSIPEQDDVFAEAPPTRKVYDTSNGTDEPPNNRRDSEETQRYTEDPTNKRPFYSQDRPVKSPVNERPSTFAYDEEQYLMPTPSKKMPKTGAARAGTSQKPTDTGYEPLTSCREPNNDAVYVNTEGESLTPTWFENVEYMATDSGIGEDSQSLLSRGNTAPRGHRVTSTQSSFNEQDELLDSTVVYKPSGGPSKGAEPRNWSSSSEETTPNAFQAAIENPEYMRLDHADAGSDRTGMRAAV